MNEVLTQNGISRREMLRMLGGGALMVGAAGLLAGCAGTDVAGPRSVQDYTMYVSTFFGTTVERYQAGTGKNLGTFVGGLQRSNGLAFGPDGDLYVVATIGNSVTRYDVKTRQVKGTLTGFYTPHTLVFGPDGNLYVPNAPTFPRQDIPQPTGQDNIQRFNGVTGAPMGTFAFVDTPFAMGFGPDGDLYVSTVVEFGNTIPKSDYITRFDGKTGASKGKFITGLKHPYSIIWDKDGNMLLPQYFLGQIKKFDGKTGQEIGTVAEVANPIGITIGPHGALYCGTFSDAAGSPNSGSVERFTLPSGTHTGAVVSGLPFVSYVAFG